MFAKSNIEEGISNIIKINICFCLQCEYFFLQRHWARFEQILHRKIALDNTLTLDVFEQLHAFDEHVSPDLLVVSTQASGEEALEVRLRNLAMMWKEQKLSIEPHEAIHNVFVLTNLTEVSEFGCARRIKRLYYVRLTSSSTNFWMNHE